MLWYFPRYFLSSFLPAFFLPNVPVPILPPLPLTYLFLGGVIPGLLIGIAQMAYISAVARRRNFPVEKPVPLRDIPRITWDAFPALMMPVILFGCLYSGITTPTEAAALAAFYALLVSAILYRGVTWRSVYNSLLTSARVTISISILIAAAMAFNYVITVENIPKTLAAMMKGYELTPFTFLLLANVILLV